MLLGGANQGDIDRQGWKKIMWMLAAAWLTCLVCFLGMALRAPVLNDGVEVCPSTGRVIVCRRAKKGRAEAALDASQSVVA